jgi:hypothetical protein
MDSYVPTHPTRERAFWDCSQSPPTPPAFTWAKLSRRSRGQKLNSPSVAQLPTPFGHSSVSSLSKSSVVPGTPLQDMHHAPPSLLAHLNMVMPLPSAVRVLNQQPLPSTLALQRQQAAAFLLDCFRQGSSPFVLPPFPINGTKGHSGHTHSSSSEHGAPHLILVI